MIKLLKDKEIVLSVTVAILVLTFFGIFSLIHRPLSFVVGTGNPGKIIKFEWDGKKFVENSFDTGYLYVHSVRMGDAENNGKNVIIAGVSNSFFAKPYGCSVMEYTVTGKTWEEELIDNVGDVRCKDLTIGDADNDSKNEVLLATHGEGFINIYKKVDGSWKKTTVDRNPIKKFDDSNNQNHKVDIKKLTYDTTVQTAIHIVKVGDIDNDGQNEVVATVSSPLEYLADEISFIKAYKYNKNDDKWSETTIDNLHGREFRSIAIGSIYNNGKNQLTIGIGTPGKDPGSVYVYSYENGKWDKKLLHDDKVERNMKGLTLGDIDNDKNNELVLATGFPNGILSIVKKLGNKFEDKKIGNIASLFNLPGSEFNSMATEVIKVAGGNSILVAGTTTTPAKKIGWEGADKGFLVLYSNDNGNWKPEILSGDNILSLDVGK